MGLRVVRCSALAAYFCRNVGQIVAEEGAIAQLKHLDTGVRHVGLRQNRVVVFLRRDIPADQTEVGHAVCRFFHHGQDCIHVRQGDVAETNVAGGMFLKMFAVDSVCKCIELALSIYADADAAAVGIIHFCFAHAHAENDRIYFHAAVAAQQGIHAQRVDGGRGERGCDRALVKSLLCNEVGFAQAGDDICNLSLVRCNVG